MTLPDFIPPPAPGELTVWKLLEELQRRHAAELAAAVCVPAHLLSGPGHRRDQGG